MSSVGTGQMSSVETGQMSAVDIRQMLKSQVRGRASQQQWGLSKARPSQAKPKSWLTKVPVGAKNIKFGPKWVENQLFGLKLVPNESYGLSGPIRTIPEAKNKQE